MASPHLANIIGSILTLYTTEYVQWKQRCKGKWQVPIWKLSCNPNHMSERLRLQECCIGKNRCYRSPWSGAIITNVCRMATSKF